MRYVKAIGARWGHGGALVAETRVRRKNMKVSITYMDSRDNGCFLPLTGCCCVQSLASCSVEEFMAELPNHDVVMSARYQVRATMPSWHRDTHLVMVMMALRPSHDVATIGTHVALFSTAYAPPPLLALPSTTSLKC